MRPPPAAGKTARREDCDQYRFAPYVSSGQDSLWHIAGPPRLAYTRRHPQYPAATAIRKSHETRVAVTRSKISRGIPMPEEKPPVPPTPPLTPANRPESGASFDISEEYGTAAKNLPPGKVVTIGIGLIVAI